MAILIDRPAWPAHGTTWAHLVSDSSLEELHAFAARLGIPRRSFDLDHYDVPAHRHDDAVAAGAELVTGRELVRRLRASGLRVRAAERGEVRGTRVVGQLRRHWTALGLRPDVGEQLLTRWSQPHRRYHDPVHLWWVLEHLGTLRGAAGLPADRALPAAAWFHDAVYDGAPGADEERSAALVEELGPVAGLTAEEVTEARRLVLLTAGHAPEPDDVAGAVLSDADLTILAASPRRYAAYVAGVRAEHGHLDPAAFAAGRARVLRAFLERPTIFRTKHGRAVWERPARENVTRELARLEPARV